MSKKAGCTLSLVLASTLIVNACSTLGEPAANDSGQSPPAAVMKPNDGPFVKYDPPIDASMALATISVLKLPPGDTWTENTWTRAYLEELGIKVSYKWTADRVTSAYQDKMNVSIASGDLPDIFMVNPQQYQQLAAAGQIQDMTEIVNQYAWEFTKAQLDGIDGLYKKAATVNGKLMGLPLIDGDPMQQTQMLWVREDWRKKLNLPEPRTMDDLVRMAEAFAKNDPDGNGKADTTGLGLNKALWGDFGIDAFLNGHHAYPGIWFDNGSGKLINGITMPQMKSGLAKLQELFKNGLIDKEFGTKDVTKLKEELNAGKVGMWFGSWSSGSYFEPTIVKNPEAAIKPYEIPSVDGTPASAQATLPIRFFYVVKKGYPHPEALVKMYNMYMAKRNGKDGKGRNPEDNDKYLNGKDGYSPYAEAPVTTFESVGDGNTDRILKAAATGDDAGLLPADRQNYDIYLQYKAGERVAGKWNIALRYDPQGPFALQRSYNKKNLIKISQFYGGSTKTMAENQASLDKIGNEKFTQIIMNASSPDTFDAFVDSWRKLGGDAITNEVNDWYKALNAK